MSDLQTILADAAYEDYLEGLRYDKEMQIATLQQCIYLLVEGETEEKTYPELLAKCDVDIEEIGVVIGNYNGCGNLIHALRLLKKTLSHDRPVIATIDNDEQGKRVCERLSQAGFNMDLITLVPMPSVVTPLEYSGGRVGLLKRCFLLITSLTKCFPRISCQILSLALKTNFASSSEKTKVGLSKSRSSARKRVTPRWGISKFVSGFASLRLAKKFPLT